MVGVALTNDMGVLGTENTDQRGNRTQFLAGNTPEERAEPAYNTQVLISKIKSFWFLGLIGSVITVFFALSYIEFRLIKKNALHILQHTVFLSPHNNHSVIIL